jgi:hypothetical protein
MTEDDIAEIVKNMETNPVQPDPEGMTAASEKPEALNRDNAEKPEGHVPDTSDDAGGNESQTKRASFERLSSVLGKLDWQTIGLILTIKAIFYVYGTQAFQTLTNGSIGGIHGWLTLWNRWDAAHYMDLAENGYQSTGEPRFLIVFYPLFPWLTRVVALAFGNYIFSGLITAGVASVVAGLVLKKLTRLDYSEAIARRAVWFMFIFPASYVLHVPYSESVLLALAIGSLLCARMDRWGLAGLLAALACLSRVNGLVLGPALLVEAGGQYWATGRFRKEWLWIGLIGVGVAGYLFLNYHVQGDPFIFMKYRREHWFQVLSWPWTGIAGKIDSATHPAGIAGEPWVIITVQELVFILLGLGATVWSWIKLRPSYAMWMTGNWMLFTSTTFLLGVPRFTVVMFPLYILLSKLANNRTWFGALTVASLLYLALFTGLYVEGHWVF